MRIRSAFSGFTARSEKLRQAQRVESVEVVLFDVNRAVGALGERFADGLRGPGGPGAQRDHLAAVLLFQLQRFFERVGVGLIDLVVQIGFLNPPAGRIYAELRVADGDLLNRNDDFHREY